MNTLSDAIKAAANYLAAELDNELLEAIDDGEMFHDMNDVPCLLAGNIAMIYLLNDADIKSGGFGVESFHETVIPMNEPNLNFVIVYDYRIRPTL